MRKRFSMKVDSNFSKWACSLTGCDGGDIEKSKIWVSGIEWGHSKEKGQSQDEFDSSFRKYYAEDLGVEMSANGKQTKNVYDIAKETNSQFGRTLAKLYAVIEGHDISDYQQVAKASDGTEIFKMNLYPIAFPDTADHYWNVLKLEEITGIQTKELYRVWCCLNRFPHFAKLVTDNEPSVIIGTGVSYLTQFALAFGSDGGIDGFERITFKPESDKNGRDRDIYVGLIGKSTLLVVTPFFGGPSGLNSDYLIQMVGDEINKRRSTS